jgi:predicted RNA-binding Zn-ribbon protein involved in translation (DUF1610 family)
MEWKKLERYCPECGADLDEVGYMTEETILGTRVAPSTEFTSVPVFHVLASETNYQKVMCGECGDDISESLPEGFVITYVEVED